MTEHIMLRVRERLPNLLPHEYNRIYEALLSELALQFPDADAVRFPDGGGMFINRRK